MLPSSSGPDVNAANMDGTTPLLRACGNLGSSNEWPGGESCQIVKKLIDAGADVRHARNDGITPLHLACSKKHANVARLLIQRGAAVDAVDEKGQSPLHLLHDLDTNIRTGGNEHSKHKLQIRNKDVALIIRALLDAGADVMAICKDGTSPLHLACTNGIEDSVKLFLQLGADVNAVDSRNETPLSKVLASFNGQIMEMLIRAGAKLDITRKDGSNPLHVACENKCFRTVSFLLEKGVDVNSEDERKETPLCTLLSACKPSIGEELSESSVIGRIDITTKLDLNASESGNGDNSWQTLRPFNSPASFERTIHCIVLELLQSGANIQHKGYNGCTPLHLACRKMDIGLVKLFVARGASVNVTDNRNNTPLHTLLNKNFKSEHRGMVYALVESGADVCAVGDKGYTPLHLACYWKDAVIARLLIEKGADVNASDDFMDTPLHIVMKRKSSQHQRDTVLCLMDAGAKLGAVGKDGLTPLHLACHRGDDVVAQCLIERGADVNAVTSASLTPLHFASKLKNPKFKEQTTIIDSLLASGAEASAVDKDGNTALHYACSEYSREGVKRILAHLKEANMTNNKDETPLHCIGYGDDNSICMALLEAGADIDAKDIRGGTPLRNACDAEWFLYRPEYIEFLITRSANTSFMHQRCENNINKNTTRFERLCMKTSAACIQRLCEFDIPLPHASFAADCQIGEERLAALSVILCRAGMNCGDSIQESFYSLLHLLNTSSITGTYANPIFHRVAKQSEEIKIRVLSCYIEFMLAAGPYIKLPLRRILNAEENIQGNCTAVGYMLERYANPVSLTLGAVQTTRRRLCKVSRGRSILPRITALAEFMPSSILDVLRLTTETDALLVELQRLMA